MEIQKTKSRTDYGHNTTSLRDQLRSRGGRSNNHTQYDYPNNDKVTTMTNKSNDDVLTPSLEDVKDELNFLSEIYSGGGSALQLIPVLAKLREVNVDLILKNLDWQFGKHILLENGNLKLVLIVWYPGEYISVHGHPRTGCVFTILEGMLHESRFADYNDTHPINTSVLSKGSIAYIDDEIGLHAVHNQGNDLAVSLHAYVS